MFSIPWHKLPVPFGLLQLVKFRSDLRENNLHDTSQIAEADQLPVPSPSQGDRHLVARTADGSYNDLAHPEMGMVGTRFGRNVSLQDATVDEDHLLEPNPRLISRTLLKRDEFIPATILNLHAASWIQFQTHDWFSHGDNPAGEQPGNSFVVPPADTENNTAENKDLKVPKTPKDPTRTDGNTTPATQGYFILKRDFSKSSPCPALR